MISRPDNSFRRSTSRDELVEWQERYRKVAGFASDDLKLSRALA
jgi:hypothetical protein